ncbi:hypothetical protein LZ32DRAFT_275607 [Colletotrichum eremochloae]|nr:hypothetical protein LZ32DRAFT_275607 [Colletotrichum eremochloae]
MRERHRSRCKHDGGLPRARALASCRNRCPLVDFAGTARLRLQLSSPASLGASASHPSRCTQKLVALWCGSTLAGTPGSQATMAKQLMIGIWCYFRGTAVHQCNLNMGSYVSVLDTMKKKILSWMRDLPSAPIWAYLTKRCLQQPTCPAPSGRCRCLGSPPFKCALRPIIPFTAPALHCLY